MSDRDFLATAKEQFRWYADNEDEDEVYYKVTMMAAAIAQAEAAERQAAAAERQLHILERIAEVVARLSA